MDLTGPTAAVGPDGTVDDEIQLTSSSSNYAISYVEIALNGYTNPRWESSPDLDGYSNAEVIDVTGGSGKAYDVYFNPTGQSGPSLQTGQNQQLTVNVYYVDQNNNKYTDTLSVAVGSSNPGDTTTLAAPTSITWNGFTASWQNQTSDGLVHINLANLPQGQTIQGAFLSDQVANGNYGSDWYYGTLTPTSQSGIPGQQLHSISSAALTFYPDTNEAGATLTLRLDFGSYGQEATQFLGGYCDPGVGTSISGTSKTETPGNPNSDFLQTDANSYGTIYLSSGTYYMNEQLILNNPVTIEPASGATATLVFEQTQTTSGSFPSPTSWPDAVRINASHVTLENFSIQFSGPFLWTTTSGSTPNVIDTSGTPSDVTISWMNIQGPTQSLFDEATNPVGSIPTSETFFDTFQTNQIGTGLKWTQLNGNWSESGGTMTQSLVSTSTPEEKLLVNSPTSFPDAEEIEANVDVTAMTPNSDARAGVSLDDNSSGQGYNLVFHETSNGIALQLLNDGVDWSTAVYNGWQLNTYYTFQLVVVPQGGGVDALFGKVWQVGTGEPTSWTIQGIQGGSDYRSPGVPALEGGSYGAAAKFQPTNSGGYLVRAVTPPLFSQVNATRWQAYQGSWSQSSGVLTQSSTSSAANKRVLFPLTGTVPYSMMISAEVTPTMSLGTDDSTVGVGLDTSSTGSGYELAFFNDGGFLGVELESGTTTFDPTTKDFFGGTLSPGTAYGMQLTVLQEPDGTDAVFGAVWPWFQPGGQLHGIPSYWNMFVGGQSQPLGSPSLDGGSSGSATASFANIYVTAATTSALPLINMGIAYTGSVTNNTLTGGTLMFSYGPWQITNNTYDGAVAGTYVEAAFSFYTGHNRTLSGNTVQQLSPYGKTLRLFDMGNNQTWASNDVISGNTVVDSGGIADQAGDFGWDPNNNYYANGTNSGEFMLFESYYMAYEGTIFTLSSDGRELKQVFDSSPAILAVSPFAMERQLYSLASHGATS